MFLRGKVGDLTLGSAWLPRCSKRLAPECVVSYRTFQEHRDKDGYLYPKGTPCVAVRFPAGELCLLFLKGDDVTAVWLPEWTGLVGIEPNVCDPMKENQAFVNEVIAEVDRRVLAEIREEVAREEAELWSEPPAEWSVAWKSAGVEGQAAVAPQPEVEVAEDDGQPE